MLRRGVVGVLEEWDGGQASCGLKECCGTDMLVQLHGCHSRIKKGGQMDMVKMGLVLMG